MRSEFETGEALQSQKNFNGVKCGCLGPVGCVNKGMLLMKSFKPHEKVEMLMLVLKVIDVSFF